MTNYGPPPPGWYYADGDPPGTHRYWDGAQWQGGPQAVPSPSGMVGYGEPGRARHASPGSRFLAYLVDVGVVIGIYVFIIAFTFVSEVFLVLGLLGLFGWVVFNFVILQGRTGQTIGRRVLGIKIVKVPTGQPPGWGLMIGRWAVQSLLGALCYIPIIVDMIYILASDRKQRFSDGWLNLEVVDASS